MTSPADVGRLHCLSLTLPYPPAVNHMWRSVGNRVLLSREARAYKRDCMVLALAAGARPVVGPVAVEVIVYRPRRAGDLDGRLKALLDAMNGVVWFDDSQVVELHAFRRDDRLNPRAEVKVWPADVERGRQT